MTIELPSELQQRLEAEARRQGVDVSEYVRAILAATTPPDHAPKAGRADRVRALKGRYAAQHSSVADFLREKHEDTLREDPDRL